MAVARLGVPLAANPEPVDSQRAATTARHAPRLSSVVVRMFRFGLPGLARVVLPAIRHEVAMRSAQVGPKVAVDAVASGADDLALDSGHFEVVAHHAPPPLRLVAMTSQRSTR